AGALEAPNAGPGTPASGRPRRRPRRRRRTARWRRAASGGRDPSGRSAASDRPPGLRRGKSPWPARSWRSIAPGWPAGERRAEPSVLAERPLDPQQLVVLGGALAAGRRSGLHLPGVRRDGEIRDRGVLRLAAPVP